jgi:hypothetical protein
MQSNDHTEGDENGTDRGQHAMRPTAGNRSRSWSRNRQGSNLPVWWQQAVKVLAPQDSLSVVFAGTSQPAARSAKGKQLLIAGKRHGSTAASRSSGVTMYFAVYYSQGHHNLLSAVPSLSSSSTSQVSCRPCTWKPSNGLRFSRSPSSAASDDASSTSGRRVSLDVCCCTSPVRMSKDSRVLVGRDIDWSCLVRSCRPVLHRVSQSAVRWVMMLDRRS